MTGKVSLGDLTSFQIKPSDYEIKKLIGRGAYAEVFLAKHKKTKQLFALKRFLTDNPSDTVYKYFEREVRCLYKARGRFILSFVGFCAEIPLTIITEFITNGNLFKALHNKTLHGTDKTRIAIGVAVGMKRIHSFDIIHRDLKSLNILLDTNQEPVIIDFGISKFQDSTHTAIGSPNWMSPELYRCEKYDTKVDVYAFGLLLWEMQYEAIPFAGKNQHQIYRLLEKGERPPLTEPIPGGIKEIVERCCKEDPNERPTFRELVEIFRNPRYFFDQTDVKKIEAFWVKIESCTNPFLEHKIEPLKRIIFVERNENEYFKTLESPTDQVNLIFHFIDNIKKIPTFSNFLIKEGLLMSCLPLQQSSVPHFVRLLSIIIEFLIDPSMVEAFSDAIEYSEIYPKDILHLFSKTAKIHPTNTQFISLFFPIYTTLRKSEDIESYYQILYFLKTNGGFTDKNFFSDTINFYMSPENQNLLFKVLLHFRWPINTDCFGIPNKQLIEYLLSLPPEDVPLSKKLTHQLLQIEEENVSLILAAIAIQPNGISFFFDKYDWLLDETRFLQIISSMCLNTCPLSKVLMSNSEYFLKISVRLMQSIRNVKDAKSYQMLTVILSFTLRSKALIQNGQNLIDAIIQQGINFDDERLKYLFRFIDALGRIDYSPCFDKIIPLLSKLFNSQWNSMICSLLSVYVIHPEGFIKLKENGIIEIYSSFNPPNALRKHKEFFFRKALQYDFPDQDMQK